MGMPATSVEHYFATLEERFVPQAAKGVSALYLFELAGEGGGNYFVKVEDGTISLRENATEMPNTTFKISASDYIDMVNGKLSPPVAFVKGRLRVTGDFLLAHKMGNILPLGK
jgi:putative sterol carrier protein